MYQIDKRIDFCYGHRVWTQNLKDDYCSAGDNETKCKHPHGHEGSIRVFLKADELDRGFVTDFKHLGWLKDFINTYVDHKFIIDINDPAFSHLVGGAFVRVEGSPNYLQTPTGKIGVQPISLDAPFGYYVPKGFHDLPASTAEVVEGFLFVDFVPTSENLAHWIYDLVDLKMKQINVVTSHIEWWETPKSRSVYFGNK